MVQNGRPSTPNGYQIQQAAYQKSSKSSPVPAHVHCSGSNGVKQKRCSTGPATDSHGRAAEVRVDKLPSLFRSCPGRAKDGRAAVARPHVPR